MIKNSERKKMFTDKASLDKGRTEGLKEELHPILTQKLSGTFQIPTVQTDHSLNNISKTNTPSPATLKIDPYREIPE